jgi:hypothetical protein
MEQGQPQDRLRTQIHPLGTELPGLPATDSPRVGSRAPQGIAGKHCAQGSGAHLRSSDVPPRIPAPQKPREQSEVRAGYLETLNLPSCPIGWQVFAHVD